MRVLVWHVHSGWLDAFVRGQHEYVLPVTNSGEGGADGRDWKVTEARPHELRGLDLDVVVLQRLEELDEVERLTGLRPGKDIGAVFVEHNTPRAEVPNSLHPLRNRGDLLISHVTHFNSLFWDCGNTPTTVIEHGIVDRGAQYSGELERLAVVINEPVRRWRVTGTDLLPAFARVAPVDVFGMKAEGLAERLGVGADAVVAAGDLHTAQLHPQLAQRRVYVHPMRWTSLGLSLLEAMHLGMPVVALDTTEARRAVPPEAGVVSTNIAELVAAARHFIEDPEAARAAGEHARAYALDNHGLARFLAQWDEVLAEVSGVSTNSITAPNPVAAPGPVVAPFERLSR